MEFLIVVVLALLAIAAATTLGPRLGVAAPLLLVVAGIGASLLPFVPAVHVEPEWILAGVLPPLLYSASVSMPTVHFRREFAAISGPSVALVASHIRSSLRRAYRSYGDPVAMGGLFCGETTESSWKKDGERSVVQRTN